MINMIPRNQLNYRLWVRKTIFEAESLVLDMVVNGSRRNLEEDHCKKIFWGGSI